MSARKGPNGEALPTKAQVTALEGIRDKGEIVASCPRAYHSAAAILLRRGWAKERTRAVRDGRGPWELTPAGETALRLIVPQGPKPGDWILCKDPSNRVSYGASGGLFKVERVGRVNVIASCDVRWAPNGPIHHQEHRIPLAHVVRVVSPEEVQPLNTTTAGPSKG